MSAYKIMLSDPRLARDRYVGRRVNRAAAWRIVCEMNRRIIEANRGRARGLPLAYCTRSKT